MGRRLIDEIEKRPVGEPFLVKSTGGVFTRYVVTVRNDSGEMLLSKENEETHEFDIGVNVLDIFGEIVDPPELSTKRPFYGPGD